MTEFIINILLLKYNIYELLETFKLRYFIITVYLSFGSLYEVKIH